MTKQQSDRPRGLLRQEDVLLMPIDGLPKGVVPVEPRNGRLVLADGEATGHAHAVPERRAGAHLFAGGALTRTSRAARYLLVKGEPAMLVHEEHDPIAVPAGAYRVVRQREYEPRAQRNWRAVAD